MEIKVFFKEDGTADESKTHILIERRFDEVLCYIGESGTYIRLECSMKEAFLLAGRLDLAVVFENV